MNLVMLFLHIRGRSGAEGLHVDAKGGTRDILRHVASDKLEKQPLLGRVASEAQPFIHSIQNISERLALHEQ